MIEIADQKTNDKLLGSFEQVGTEGMCFKLYVDELEPIQLVNFITHCLMLIEFKFREDFCRLAIEQTQQLDQQRLSEADDHKMAH